MNLKPILSAQGEVFIAELYAAVQPGTQLTDLPEHVEVASTDGGDFGVQKGHFIAGIGLDDLGNLFAIRVNFHGEYAYRTTLTRLEEAEGERPQSELELVERQRWYAAWLYQHIGHAPYEYDWGRIEPFLDPYAVTSGIEVTYSKFSPYQQFARERQQHQKRPGLLSFLRSRR